MVEQVVEQKKAINENIKLPEGVTVTIKGKSVTVKGPEGETVRELIKPSLKVTAESDKVNIIAESGSQRAKKLVGSLKAHISNMIGGVVKKHVYKLKVCFTHFPMTVEVSGKTFEIKNYIGEKTPRKIDFPEDVDVSVKNADIIVESVSKESAGQTAASIENLAKRGGFDPRVFGDGIYIVEKDGKEIN
jgi:large subunit ribosomal protein L6